MKKRWGPTLAALAGLFMAAGADCDTDTDDDIEEDIDIDLDDVVLAA